MHKIWAAHGLKPHLSKTFKLSRDPNFVAKVEDIVGLYLNPPDKALVLAVDEKSQIQALDRTQPGLPMKKGRCGTMTHDYKRNGTTTLFAALNMLDGTVIGQCMPRHRHREFLRFLKTIDERTLPNLDLHLIVDNYATHKTPAVKRWLKRHSRFHLHFTPTSGSWLNMVERFFAEITRKRIRRGVFKSGPFEGRKSTRQVMKSCTVGVRLHCNPISISKFQNLILKSLVSFPAMNTFRTQLPDGFDLPKRLSRLGELAYNLWWTWRPKARRAYLADSITISGSGSVIIQFGSSAKSIVRA